MPCLSRSIQESGERVAEKHKKGKSLVSLCSSSLTDRDSSAEVLLIDSPEAEILAQIGTSKGILISSQTATLSISEEDARA